MKSPETQAMREFAEILAASMRQGQENNSGLSAEQIVRALTHNPRLQRMFRSGSSRENGLSLEYRLEKLRDQVQRLRTQNNELMKDILELQQEKDRLADCARKSVLHLTTCLKPCVDDEGVQILDDLKSLLLDHSSSWEDVEKQVLAFKTSCLASPSTHAEDHHPPVAASAPEERLQELRDQFMDLIQLLHLDLGDEYLRQWHEVNESFLQCSTTEEMVSATRALVELSRHFSESLNKERSLLARFFSDIGQDLLEMEALLTSTAAHTRETYDADRRFNLLIDGKMQEISASVNLTETLEELKNVVEAKLAVIKEFIKKKQEEDDSRFRKTGESTEALQKSLKRMKAEITEMQERTRRLEKQALLDALTGVPNRRAFDRRLQEEMHRFQRYGHVFALLLIDLDHFKNVNDTYGHATGDKCLKEVARRMRSVLRRSDVLARFGGEEFAVILPGIDREKAFRVGEKLRRAVEKTKFLYRGERIPLTISVGVTQCEETDRSAENVFERADKALYKAKNHGRNRVESL